MLGNIGDSLTGRVTRHPDLQFVWLGPRATPLRQFVVDALMRGQWSTENLARNVAVRRYRAVRIGIGVLGGVRHQVAL
jgi:hypothetical protein